MSRLSYREVTKLNIGVVQVIDNKAYHLVSMIFYADRIELAWRSVISSFLDNVIVKFPGVVSYHRLGDLLDTDQFPKRPYIEEVVYRSEE